MSLPRIASRDDWRAARIELLAREKELTRQRDALSAERRNLPMVEIEKDYVLDGPAGPARLPDLFEGRAQLIIYHFMYDPEWEVGCSSCTAGTDELSAGFLDHLHTRDTTYAMVSRAPLAKLEAWKAERGWDVPWYSSYGTDFNYDFGVARLESSVTDRRFLPCTCAHLIMSARSPGLCTKRPMHQNTSSSQLSGAASHLRSSGRGSLRIDRGRHVQILSPARDLVAAPERRCGDDLPLAGGARGWGGQLR
jgi:hypothetical protein